MMDYSAGGGLATPRVLKALNSIVHNVSKSKLRIIIWFSVLLLIRILAKTSNNYK